MTNIALQGGNVVFTGGKIGTGQPCCCGCDCYSPGSYRPALETVVGRGLVWLSFSACIGSGAEATVDAPHATGPCDYDGLRGPITGVTLTNAGSGYAVLGRVQPTISASVGGGSGSTLSVTLAEESEFLNPAESCMPVPWWKVSSVSVTAGGSGYTDDQPVTFTAAGGDTTIHAAAGRAYVDIAEPENETFTITTSGGSGAVLEAVWELLASDQWSARAANPCPAPKKKAYRLVSVTVTNGGSGYAQFDLIDIGFPSADDGVVVEAAYIDVDAVDGTGAITSVFVAPDDGTYTAGPAGKYTGSATDALASVVVNSCTTNGDGKYYREDASEPPYVADVTVTVNQEEPSSGSGASVTATVESDTSSPDFGKIASLTLASGGDDYLDVPLACTLDGKLYVAWGAKTVEVPLSSIFASSVFIDGICNTYAGADGVGLTYGFECGGVAGDVGNTGSVAFGIIDSLGCNCDEQIHILVSLYFVCGECFLDGPRSNLGRGWSICLRFDKDENGCPVGDAQVISQEGDSQRSYNDRGNCANPLQECIPCADQFLNVLPVADCTCDGTCDAYVAPVISFLPP